MKRVVLPMLVALAAACAKDDATEPSAPKSWHVADGAIRDASGRTVVLRGANFAGSHKYKPYVSDFGPGDLARLKNDWGFDAVRMLLVWAAVEPDKGVYDEEFLDALEERVKWARDAGLLVVLDMHQDLYGEGFAGGDGAPRWTCDEAKYAAFVPKDPWFLGSLDRNVMECVDRLFDEGSENRAHFVAAWRHVAKRLAPYDHIVGFDVLNEPNWGTYAILAFENDRLAPFYTEVARAVREEAPSWLVFAEPGASRNVGYPSGLPKLPLEGVVYAPHSYDRDAESGNGFDDARRAAVIDNVKSMRAEADALGAALWIGEYGGQADHPGIAPYMNAQYDGIGAVAAGSMYWAFDKGGGYSLLNADGSARPVLVDLVARPYPARVAGKLVAYSFDASARVAKIRMAADPEITEPTEIVAPAHVWPNGVRVECGGCTVEEAPGLVRLRDVPAGEMDISVTGR